MRHFVFLCLWLVACLCNLGLLRGDDADPSAVRGVEKVNFSIGGMGLYLPEKWGMIQLSLRNPQDREVSLLASTHFVDDPTLQYGRRLWMPAHSRMTTWHPLRMPAISEPGQDFFETQSLIISTAGETETLAMNDVGSMQFTQSLRVAPDEPVTAVIAEPMISVSESSRGALWANSMDLLLTARYERGMSRNLSILHEHLSPAGEELLDGLDHLVISDDRIMTDAAGLGAIRRWVTGGGRLWIMADRVPPELLEALLGDEHALTVVDQVGITHARVVAAPGTSAASPFERDLDRPAPLVRVLADNIEPVFLVEGWPAAFWKSSGNGRILVTTLGADGWLRPRQPQDPNPNAVNGGSFKTGFFPGEPLNKLAADFFTRRPPAALSPAVAEEQVRQMIGYTIPSRGLVLGTLLGFTGLLAASAVWLSRTGRLEWLGVATPVASVLACGLLLGAGMNAQSEIAEATTTVQYVQAVPGTDDIRMNGVAGVFTQGHGATAALSGTGGGWMLPEMSGIEGTTRRLVWTDLDRWSWENLTQKPGLRTIHTQASGRAATPVSASAGFLTGQLAGHVSLPTGLQPSDAILATPAGRIGITLDGDGQWTADEELGEGQYLSANVLSDEQQRRTRILSAMLQSTPTQTVPLVPTLYVWTQPWPVGLSYYGDPTVGGSALVSIPVHWQRPPAGTEFTIPRPLLTYREVTGPDDVRPSGFFDNRAGQWVERTGRTAGWVAFDLPHALLPLETRRVDVTFKVIGSMGRLELSGFQAGAVRSLKIWDNPVGTLTFSMENGSLMPIDPSGRLMFRVEAGVANTAPEFEPLPEAREHAPATLPDDAALPQKPEVNPLTYWQFEEISARITVTVPGANTASTTAP